MFQITIDYNRAHIRHSEPIRTVALQDEANEFARHLASNMIYALTTDSFYDGFSDADPFTATLTDYEKSVLYSVFLAKPDDFWFHVINDQTGELVNAAVIILPEQSEITVAAELAVDNAPVHELQRSG